MINKMDKDFILIKNSEYLNLLEEIKSIYKELHSIAKNQENFVKDSKALMEIISNTEIKNDLDTRDDDNKKQLFDKSKYLLEGFTFGILFSLIVNNFFSFT